MCDVDGYMYSLQQYDMKATYVVFNGALYFEDAVKVVTCWNCAGGNCTGMHMSIRAYMEHLNAECVNADRYT